MGVFATELQVKQVSSGWWKRTWKITAPLKFKSEITGDIIVPTGFVTDFASVPRLPLVWWLAGATAQKAAVVHDYLYRKGKYSRKVADRVFREAMQASGLNIVHRNLMYLGVRALGQSAYKE